jgi:hypothetical protein
LVPKVGEVNSGTVKLTKTVDQKLTNTETHAVDSEVSTIAFLKICKERLSQLRSVGGLSSRCRKVFTMKYNIVKDASTYFGPGVVRSVKARPKVPPSLAVRQQPGTYSIGIP